MENYTMSLDWKNQYCHNDYSNQGNVHIQCNSYQIANGTFHRARTKKIKNCIETQKTPNRQSNFEKVKRSWRIHAP